jgi:hypothetical protein
MAAAQRLPLTEGAATVTTCTRESAMPADGSLLLTAAVVMFGLLCVLVGACAGAYALWRLAPLALRPAAAKVEFFQPAAAASAASEALPHSTAASATASQTTSEAGDDDDDDLHAARWVTRTGKRMHTHNCSGVNNFGMRKVTPCVLCRRMRGVPTTLR